MQKNILNYNSVENIPHINAKAAFQCKQCFGVPLGE